MTEQRIATLAMIIALLLGMLGCTPRVRVISNPAPGDQGIRYYRPKPYLKVVPAEVQFAKEASKIEPALVSITLEYLPNFSEEYAIDVRPGLGIADVSVTLQDGWNLTEISQDLDSQTDENVSAAGDVIKALTGFVPTAAEDPDSLPQFTVPATDVPLGYYESVIGRGPDGRKRLYGFRYLGFLPYQSCPTTMGGSEKYCCGDGSAPLYGLTFDQGRMVFKPLVEMQLSERQKAATDDFMTALPLLSGRQEVAFDAADAEQQASLAASLEIELLGMLRQRFPEVQRVAVDWTTQENTPGLRTDIFVSDSIQDPVHVDRIRQTAVDSLARVSQGRFLFDVQVQ